MELLPRIYPTTDPPLNPMDKVTSECSLQEEVYRVFYEMAQVLHLSIRCDFDNFRYDFKEAELTYHEFEHVDPHSMISFLKARTAAYYMQLNPYDALNAADGDDIVEAVLATFPLHLIQDAGIIAQTHLLFICQRYVYLIIWTLSDLDFFKIDNPGARQHFDAWCPMLLDGFPEFIRTQVTFPDILDAGPNEMWFHEARLQYCLLDMCSRLTEHVAILFARICYFITIRRMARFDSGIVSWKTYHDDLKPRFRDVEKYNLDWCQYFFQEFQMMLSTFKRILVERVVEVMHQRELN